eukprot:4500202-Amphidinium_carterae.1
MASMAKSDIICRTRRQSRLGNELPKALSTYIKLKTIVYLSEILSVPIVHVGGPNSKTLDKGSLECSKPSRLKRRPQVPNN